MRTLFRISAVFIIVACLAAAPFGQALANGSDTLTLTVYPRLSHEKLLGVVIPWGSPETLTLENYRITDMRGNPRDHVLLETSAGVTRLPFDNVRRIDFVSYARLYKMNTRMNSIRYHVRANVFLTDGTRIENAVLNAHWGLVEGHTELGDFYLDNPLTVSSLTFNRH